MTKRERALKSAIMENLMARTEIHDAWANVVLAEALMAQAKYEEAAEIIVEAEGHYRRALSATTIVQSGSIVDRLADLKVKLDQVRFEIRKKGACARHA